MMGLDQPDVTLSEQAIPGQSNALDSAVPLFIGYTQEGPTYSAVRINSFSDFEEAFGGPAVSAAILYYAVKLYFDNNGSGGFVLSLGDYDDLTDITADQLITAFSDARVSTAIATESSITLVAIPDMVLLDDADAVHWSQAWLSLLAICQARQGVFGIVDTPDLADNASACLNGFLSNHPANPEWGAAYWPHLVTNYGEDGQDPIVVPPSAAVMAVIESTDRQSGVWKAPANIALAQMVKPSQPWQQSDGLFQPSGASLNLIRSFPGRGTRVWGCRTLTSDADSPWRYVQIRRLVAYIEAQLSGIARHLIFETNNAITWIKLKGLAHIGLRELWLDGGLYGSEEQEAFYIQIGLNETMTEDDIRQGKIIMKVGVAVTYPAEFIVISLTFDTRMSLIRSSADIAAETL
jgi:hypothetical protein